MKRQTNRFVIAVGLSVLLNFVGARAAAASSSALERDFRHPPASARPWVYWMWMDGNLSREGITADLEAMQRAGLDGVIIMEVDVGIPRGRVKLIGDQSLPKDQRVTWTTWNPFKKDSPLLESGLLGPVQLVATEQLMIKSR